MPLSILGVEVPYSVVVMVMIVVLSQAAIPVDVVFLCDGISECFKCLINYGIDLSLTLLIVNPLLNSDRVSCVDRVQQVSLEVL